MSQSAFSAFASQLFTCIVVQLQLSITEQTAVRQPKERRSAPTTINRTTRRLISKLNLVTFLGLGFQKLGWEMGFGKNLGWEMGFVLPFRTLARALYGEAGLPQETPMWRPKINKNMWNSICDEIVFFCA